jgi:hypothetical protein
MRQIVSLFYPIFALLPRTGDFSAGWRKEPAMPGILHEPENIQKGVC